MTLREQLLELTEPKYMKFTSALMPGVENVLGIRLPVLRSIAKEIAAGDWRAYLAEAEDFYFEERMLSPIVDEVAEERTDVKVGKVNVDEQPDLAAEFGVMSIPTLLLFENGKLVRQAVGARPKSGVLELLG